MTEKLVIAGHPDATLSVLLFQNVTNSKQLQERVVSGDLPAEFAFLNAVLVPDLFLLRLAAEVALKGCQAGALKTRSLHSEVVYNLSGSRHITESFRRYGITEHVTHVLAARFDASSEEIETVKALVQGELLPLSKLSDVSDEDLLVKYHKVTPQELEIGTLVDAITCHMATRDVL